MTKKRKRQIMESSVPLVRLGETDLSNFHETLPNDSASGCLFKHNDSVLIASVEHATGNEGGVNKKGQKGNWAVQLEFDTKNTKTILYKLGAMHYEKRISKYSNGETVDFSYKKLKEDFVAYRQNVNESLKIIDSYPIKIFDTSSIDLPRKGDKYGFCGLVKPVLEWHAHFGYFIYEKLLNVYDDLEFIGEHDDVCVFQLPRKHPGHAAIEGCSGAPILNKEGNPVALVLGGDEEKDIIYGISLNSYRFHMELM